MSSDFSDVIKKGPVKIKGKRLGIWKSQWLQLHSASSRGPIRLEKYSSESAAEQSYDDVHKSIPLTHLHSMKRLTVDSRKQAIEISFSGGQLVPFMFCPENDMEADSWYSELDQVRCSLDDASNSQSMFHVYLLPTPNLSAHGECWMQVTSKDVTLYESGNTQHVITRWPLASVRRFGRETSKFTIESGRSSPTGEGIFTFSSWQSELIYQTVEKASRVIAECVHVVRTTSLNNSMRVTNSPAVPHRNQVSLSLSDTATSPPTAPRPTHGIPRGNSLPSSARGPLPSVPGT